jgi:predicted aspartyl protease
MRFWVCVSFCVVLLCAPAGAAPDVSGDLPDAATLKARVDALAAAAPPNYRETIIAHSKDEPDSGWTTYHRFDNSRTVEGSGPTEREYGTFDGQDWRRDANGVTVVNDDVPEEPRLLTIARGDAPGTYVLSNLTKGGYGTRTVVDATTLRELRVDEIDPISTTTSITTTYGKFGGYTMPATWTETVTNAGTTTTATYTRSDVVLGGVTADQVAVPATPDVVTLPPGGKPVELPSTFSDGSVLLHASVAGQSALFVLDSGSQVITVSPGLAKRANLKEVDSGVLSGSGTVNAKEVIIPVLQIGPLTMHDVIAVVTPVGTYGFNQDDFGLIGFDFLATLAVSIDYFHQHVTVQSGWDFVGPKDAFPIDLRLGNFLPQTTAIINGATADHIIVDTGASGTTLLLFQYFSKKHPEIFDDPGFQQIQFSGIGGHAETQAFFFRTIKIGHLTLEKFNGYRTADSHSFNWDADGLFGSEFLSHFTVIFDFVHAKMYLRQNHDGGLLPVGR